MPEAKVEVALRRIGRSNSAVRIHYKPDYSLEAALGEPFERLSTVADDTDTGHDDISTICGSVRSPRSEAKRVTFDETDTDTKEVSVSPKENDGHLKKSGEFILVNKRRRERLRRQRQREKHECHCHHHHHRDKYGDDGKIRVISELERMSDVSDLPPRDGRKSRSRTSKEIRKERAEKWAETDGLNVRREPEGDILNADSRSEKGILINVQRPASEAADNSGPEEESAPRNAPDHGKETNAFENQGSNEKNVLEVTEHAHEEETKDSEIVLHHDSMATAKEGETVDSVDAPVVHSDLNSSSALEDAYGYGSDSTLEEDLGGNIAEVEKERTVRESLEETNLNAVKAEVEQIAFVEFADKERPGAIAVEETDHEEHNLGALSPPAQFEFEGERADITVPVGMRLDDLAPEEIERRLRIEQLLRREEEVVQRLLLVESKEKEVKGKEEGLQERENVYIRRSEEVDQLNKDIFGMRERREDERRSLMELKEDDYRIMERTVKKVMEEMNRMRENCRLHHEQIMDLQDKVKELDEEVSLRDKTILNLTDRLSYTTTELRRQEFKYDIFESDLKPIETSDGEDRSSKSQEQKGPVDEISRRMLPRSSSEYIRTQRVRMSNRMSTRSLPARSSFRKDNVKSTTPVEFDRSGSTRRYNGKMKEPSDVPLRHSRNDRTPESSPGFDGQGGASRSARSKACIVM